MIRRAARLVYRLADAGLNECPPADGNAIPLSPAFPHEIPMMKPSLLMTMLAAALLLGGCASQRVIVDTQGVDMTRYNQDYAQCETYAAQVNTGGQVARSAGFGAAVGAALGAIFGNSRDVGRAAAGGGVVGGAKGAVRGDNEKTQVLRNCLRGRGYRVLN